MTPEIANEVGKIAALVARLGNQYVLQLINGRLNIWAPKDLFATVNITKTRKSDRIPALRRLADRLRAELKARDRK